MDISALVTTFGVLSPDPGTLVRIGSEQTPHPTGMIKNGSHTSRPPISCGQTLQIACALNPCPSIEVTPCTKIEFFSPSSELLAAGITLGQPHDRDGMVIWCTGLSGAGKTTISESVASYLRRREIPVAILDGDVVRTHLSLRLGYDAADRQENIRRIAYAASILERRGFTVLVSAISPYRNGRLEARAQARHFVEVYVNTPVEVCEMRDVKGLYKRARSGDLRHFAEFVNVYEPPQRPEIVCLTQLESVEESTSKVVTYVCQHLLHDGRI